MEKDPNQWVQYEQQGLNIGARIMLNPAIFDEMSNEINILKPKRRKVAIADVGAGTGSLSREFLLEDISRDPALDRCARKIQTARGRVAHIMNIDNQLHYLDEGRKITNDERIAFNHAHASALPIEDESVDLIVSRQMLMHLSPDELQQHFREISRVLRHKCAYVFTVTNPAVEHLKHVLSKGGTWDSILEPGQAYDYPHGEVGIPDHIQGSGAVILQNMIGARQSSSGTTHFLRQYFHIETSYRSAISRAGLGLEKIDPLYAVIYGFEKTHSRYYAPSLPSSLLFKVRKY